MHPVQIEDVPAVGDTLALIGLGVFVLLVVGMCVYIVWKLPRAGDDQFGGP